MARLKDGYEADYHGRPDVYRVLGIGRVIASDELGDGRYNIMVRGLARAELDEELPPVRLYRQIRARLLAPDGSPAPAVLTALHQKLIALCDQLALVLDHGGEQLRKLVRTDSSPGGCSDVVCAALVTNLDHRQRFLEMGDPMERLTFAIQHVGSLLSDLGPPTQLMS
jgi:Lon protease-like protein